MGTQITTHTVKGKKCCSGDFGRAAGTGRIEIPNKERGYSEYLMVYTDSQGPHVPELGNGHAYLTETGYYCDDDMDGEIVRNHLDLEWSWAY